MQGSAAIRERYPRTGDKADQTTIVHLLIETTIAQVQLTVQMVI